MNNEQFINNLVRYDCFGVLSNAAKDYNEAVTRLALHGENTFTEELLIAMVKGQYTNSAAQKAAIAFCYGRILEKQNDIWRNTLVETPERENYFPELTSEWPSWAIDSNGLAYHYKARPRLRLNTWIRQQNVHGIKFDENFDGSNYKHMWAGEAWKTSVVSLEETETQEIYTPNFPEGMKAWAVDNNGEAFFYPEEPKKRQDFWMYCGSQKDYSFNKDRFLHMWIEGAWENTLVMKPEITNYVPVFVRESDEAWAIDSSGEAYFYEDSEDMACDSQQWGSDSFYHKDYNFDKVKYEHMWKGIAWTNSKIVKESKDYNPVYPEGKTAWAIDHDGDAFYYNESPRRCTYAWTSNKGYTVDSNFDSNKYKHMWADGAWRNSLKCK